MSRHAQNPFLKQAKPEDPTSYNSQPTFFSNQPPVYNQSNAFSQQQTPFYNQTSPSFSTGNTVFDMALNQTTNLMKSKIDNYTPEAKGLWSQFKKYFHVSNQYVISKLKRLFFPFATKQWKRITHYNTDGSTSHPPPREDVNSPDLYIPTMAIFTYIIVAGFTAGTRGQFSPGIISTSLSRCFVASIMEWLILACIFYLTQTSISFFDLVAITSYKYVGMCCNALVSILISETIYPISLLYTGICTMYFTLHTLSSAIKHDKNEGGKKSKLIQYVVFM